MIRQFKEFAFRLTLGVIVSLPFTLHSQEQMLLSKSSSPVCNTFVYVSLDSAHCIAVYKMDSRTGKLHFIEHTYLEGSLGALAVDPKHRMLYAAIRSKNQVSSYRIHPTTGKLSFGNSLSAAGNPVYLSTDRTGRFLLTAYFADSKAAVYALRNDGTPMEAAVHTLPTDQNAHAILADPSNRFVLIPCRTGETIHQLKFDAATGFCTPNTPDRIHTDSLTGPRHLTFHTKLNVVYVVNEFSSTVTAYRLDPARGTLAAFQSLSTLPREFTGQNKAADIHLTPDNRFLYASNRGDESIAGYAIDSVSGAMTLIGFFATEKTPRSFDIEPGGQFLYAGGQGSRKLAAYRIDNKTGQLTLIETYNVGEHPAWALVVQLNEPEK